MRYHVIIVGGGSAGTILAARLSEDPNRSVLLLEEGPEYPDPRRVPELIATGYHVMAGLRDPHIRNYAGIANSHKQEPMLMPAGRVLGGTGAINGSIFLRGAPQDFDAWAARGNTGWAFRNVLPYFLRIENDLDYGGDFHSKDGPLPIRRIPRGDWEPNVDAFYRACLDAGFPGCPDMNAPGAAGVGPYPHNNLNGRRINTAMAYVDPVRSRLNLTIRANTLVNRILFEGKRAVGVEAVAEGQSFRVYGREVISCAGAFGSPMLLMRSGVGPADRLAEFGIETVHESPGVGSNLRNHPVSGVVYRDADGAAKGSLMSQVVLRYTASGSTTPADMSISVDNRWVVDGRPHTRLGVCVEHAKGSGRLTLTGTDPTAPPGLEYRYLDDPWDLRRMREGVRLAARLGESRRFRGLFDRRAAPTDEQLAGDDALDRWILENITTGHHSSGTCKMGPAEDPMAVVDPRGRVHGLDGLRVVDASVMPDLVRVNPHATVMMIAERMSEFFPPP